MATILIVDDEDSLRRLYRSELEAAGFEVRERDSAIGLADELSVDPPTLMVLDIKLPGPSGLDVLSELRARYPDLPIVLCSAFSSFQGDTRTLPADAYVLKSSDVTGLVSTIQRLLSERV